MPTKQGRWSWPHYLAVAAVPVLLLQTWTLAAWLADGPHQITEFRDTSAISWKAARVYEGIGIIVSIVVIFVVGRECRRKRQLTFDAKFLICGVTLFWDDAGTNFFQPIIMYSSNWVNVNSPLGHMPFVSNPDIGRLPDPILFTIPLESTIWLAITWGVCRYVRFISVRWPGLSTAQIIALVMGTALVAEVLVEPLIVGVGLWTYASPAWMSIPFGQSLRLPFPELLVGMFYFGCPALMRYFKNDRGETIIDRGLDRMSSWKRTVVSLLAMYMAFQFIAWGPATVPDILIGPYQEPWPELPAHLVNDLCDAPGHGGTRYGPCPGSEGFRMPGRATSLPSR
jgi:hypothetical protein